MTRIHLSNGAANWGYNLLSETKCKLSDLFVSGSLALKLKASATMPERDQSVPIELFIKSIDAQRSYKETTEAWLDKSFGPEEGIEVSNEERDFMRQLLKKKGEKEELPGVYHVADLCRAFELDKP